MTATPTTTPTAAPPAFREIPRRELHPSPYNPKDRWENPDPDLAASITAQGIIEPLIVRPRDKGGFEIIAGHRRYAAATLLQLATLPAIVRTLTPAQAAEIQLVENDQREDLSPLARANLYASYLQATGRTQEQLAQGIGRTAAHVSQVLSLLQLPKKAVKLIDAGKVDFTAARELVRLAPFPKRLDGVLKNLEYGDGHTVKEVARQVKWALEDEANENARVKAQEAAKAQAATARTKTKADKKAAAEAKRQRELEAQRRAKSERERIRQQAVTTAAHDVIDERAGAYAKSVAKLRGKIQMPAPLLLILAEMGIVDDIVWGFDSDSGYGKRVGDVVRSKLPGKWSKQGRPVDAAAEISAYAIASWLKLAGKQLDKQLEKAGAARIAAAKAKPKKGAAK